MVVCGPMAFEFIDSNAPVDPAARQRIRRQAALGKNLGRKISRPSRKQAQRQQPHPVVHQQRHPGSQAAVTSQQADPGSGDDDDELLLPAPGAQIGNGLSQLKFRRIGPDGLVMNAISFVLQAPRSAEMGIGKAVDPGKVHMFSRLMFQDEAYFHGTVALALRALSSRPEADALASTLAIQHMARSLQLINSRLSGRDGITDINLAVVVVMTQYTRMSGQLDDCRIHLHGLERMVQLKGGINAIRPDLAEKVFRADLSCAYHLSSPPRFTLDEVKEFARATVGPDGFLSIAQRQETLSSAPSGLMQSISAHHRNIFLDATRLTRVLDEAYSGKRAWLSVRTLHEATLYIGYQIVGSPPQMEAGVDGNIDFLTRLGLVTFCLSFFRNFDSKIIESSPLGIAIIKVIQGLPSRGRWSEELVLWILLLGHVVQIFGDDLWPSVMRRAKQSVEAMQLSSWRETTKMLTKYPWSDALNGNAGKVMWDMLGLMPGSTSTAFRTQFEVPLR